MDITHSLKHSMLAVGATPVLWLLLALSVASLAVIFERMLFFARAKVNIHGLIAELSALLHAGDVQAARALLERSRSAEATVARAGLREIARGATAVREALSGAALLERARLERGLGFLGSLATNSPFIGLFGTVVGIMLAFDQLSLSSARSSASSLVMASIAEALVATAVGIGVAIPAVIAFNVFQKRIRVVLDQATALGHALLVHIDPEQR